MGSRGPKIGFRGSETFRFWSRVKILDNGCWEWQGGKNKDGYGTFSLEAVNGVRGRKLAHVYAYEKSIGPFPHGLISDHLCRNHACVNPLHIEPVTLGENVLRGEGFAAVNKKKTHCPRGHPYSRDNLKITKLGHRLCRACIKMHSANQSKLKYL